MLLRDVKRIGSIVEGVARYSLNQQGKMSTIDIGEVIQSSLNIYKSALDNAHVDISLKQEYKGTIQIQGNFDQLEQVFNNLIENALHALDKQSTPSIQILLHKKEVKANGMTWVEISFTDNGTGIPPFILERIFDPFITSKDTGDRSAKKGWGLDWQFLNVSSKTIRARSTSIMRLKAVPDS